MKKINGIKLIFAALPVIVIVLLLFIRYYGSTQSYKTLAEWGKGKYSQSESFYYNHRVGNIVSEWRKAGNNQKDSKDSNNTFLHFDMEQKAIWLEENGQVKNENYIKLPEFTKWTLSYEPLGQQRLPSTVLPQKTILKRLSFDQLCSGIIILNGTGQSPFGFGLDFPANSLSPQVVDFNSLIVSEEEYKKYKDSLPKINTKQTSEKENSKTKTIGENKSRWLDIEKYLYMEIDGQVRNVGYELSSIEVEAGSDYTGAYAVIEGHGENIIYKLLDLGGGSKTVRAYLKIDYLGDNIWYARTAQHPRQKLESDRKLNLEFLIFPKEQIPRREYKKYIKQGRSLQRSESFLSSKWKAALDNGVVVEIIGIRAFDEQGDKWWGPDGSRLDSNDFFAIEPINAGDSNFEIVWNIKWPEKKTGKQMFFSPEGAKTNRSVSARDRYGNINNFMISVFDNSLEKTSFRIGIQETEAISRYAGFKNISFIPGVDQGFEIESEQK